MKIIIAGLEVCGMIHDLGKEWKRQGHRVITISASGNRFYNYKYDLNPDDLIFSYLYYKTGNRTLSKALKYCASKISLLKRGYDSFIIRNLLNWGDCYVQVYNSGLWEEERLLKYLKKKEKKIITLFVGSDIRDYIEFKSRFNIRHWNFTEEFNAPGTDAKLRKLRLHEKYSTAIFSVPDQSLKATRPFFHLQLGMEIGKFNFNIPGREIPLVVHAPSNSLIKGSDLIVETLTKLKEEGIKFELRLLENMQHEDLLKELTNADLLIDEIILHGPGFLSFEAMLSGCAVATKFLETSPESFRPPVWNINEDNIIQQLKILLSDKDLRINLAKQGRDYSLRNNNIEKVARDILYKMTIADYDYYPAS